MKETRIRRLATVLALAMLLSVNIPVQGRTKQPEEFQTVEQKHAKYYKRNPVYQRGRNVIFPKQKLIIKNAWVDKRKHLVLVGTKVLRQYMFDRHHVVSFQCYPTGWAARNLPGRGAKDSFFGIYGIRKISLDGWVWGQTTLKRRHGHRTKIRINLFCGQYMLLTRHTRHGKYWWYLEDYFR